MESWTVEISVRRKQNQPANRKKKKSSLKHTKSQANVATDCVLIFDRTTARSEMQAADGSAENGIFCFAAPHLANAILPAHSLQPSSSQDDGTEVFLLI